MRKVERDLALELKIVDMLNSSDNEMYQLGMILAEEYIDSYKKFQLMKEEGLLNGLRKTRTHWFDKREHHQWLPRGRALLDVAKKNERKRRNHGFEDPRQMRANDEW